MTVEIIRYGEEGFDIKAMASLIEAYHRSLEAIGMKLDFQGIEEEIQNLPGRYHQEKGGQLYLAKKDGIFVGCAAFYDMGQRRAELKRLYVAPEARGNGISRLLVNAAIKDAKDAEYQWLCLDSVMRLTEAAGLYKKMGFVQIPAYNDNPFHDAYWMARSLLNKQ